MNFLKEFTKTQILLTILAFVILLNIVLSYFITSTPKTKKSSCQSQPKKSTKKTTEKMTNIPTVKGYFASWCHNCTNMKSEWEKFMNEANSNKTAKVKEVYCDKDGNEKKCHSEGIRGFPTILFTKDGTTKEYVGKRTAKALHKFAKNM